ncbi:MAG: CRTAC1 family protein, partial [Bdellovibrionales bacterium]|nr:CRTAC1 family protein [Bdellovibrionales bacterium]
IGIQSEGIGMGMAIGDLNNDGLLDILKTNVQYMSQNRLRLSCAANWGTEENLNRPSPLNLFTGMKNGNKKTFVETSFNYGLTDVGEGLGAVELIDYNNDGNLDIYIANGLWSGTEKSEDISSLFSRSSEFGTERAIREERTKETQSAIMKLLANYRGSISGKKGEQRLSLGGFQRNRLFRNNGDGTFMEVGYLEGVDSIADGYIVSVDDINNDGKQDLILRNADPGVVEVKYPPVQVLKNVGAQKASVRIRLVGNSSNRDGIGAEIIAKLDNGISQIRQVIANNGTAQSEPIIHFGLGSSQKINELMIKWPSGISSTVKDIKPGFYTIEEPKDYKKVSSAN